ncbi:MAG: hypothetical protein CMH48_08065 [Muricauda sp.]|nr:TfoX/Sxy family protein [Allomuricauda sp.]MBC30787.1 hypothetical protein [Allomuricauda sp.]|tara:strand:+ start:1395 stop:1727 length:333 start_codon:yes stop_codon:yes gene_type:complete
MPYNQEFARRISAALKSFPEKFEEKKMFGGIAYLYKGKMTVGIVKDDLMIRVVEAKMPAALQKPHVRPMDFTKRPMKEFVFVSPEGCTTEQALHYYIELGLEHAKSTLKN